MRIVVVALLLFSAGCISELSPEAEPTPEAPGGAAFVGTDTVSGCEEAGMAILVEPASAAALLPQGFAPADASGLFGLPTATGKAAIYTFIQSCEASGLYGAFSEGQMSVFIEPPAGSEALPAAFNFYPTVAVSGSDALLARFALVAWPYANGSADTQSAAMAAGGATATGTVEDADGLVFSFSVQAPGESELDGIGRFWQTTTAGLARVDHRLTTTLAAGAATCTLRAGTPAAEALGSTECQPGDAVGLVLLPFDYEATYALDTGGAAPPDGSVATARAS